ncbi:DET1 homolog [Tigriopus californicus]|uniref:DET1 homolog n=1 Tax=Tigriopus californicus TaxID=6832 RepID=UPI0027DA81E8|nr:DET1 homolog [Tigriopus californicus]
MPEATDHVPDVKRVFKPRRLPSQNIVDRFMSREHYGIHFRRNALDTNRGFYTNVYPNYTISNVEKPNCFLRKFTPDGKRFIAFSQNQTHLEIYLYKGPSAMNEAVCELWDSDFLLPMFCQDPAQAPNIRRVAFERFFTLEHLVLLTPLGQEQLNRECSLFSDDGEYVIVGSACFLSDEQHPPMWRTHQNNESVAPNPRHALEDYTLHSIEISEGFLVDRVSFKADKIYLSHNQGLYLYKDTLTVLSVQHQTIHVFKFVMGKFVPVRKIGRLIYEDDDYLLSHTLTSDQQTSLPGNFTYRPYREQTINLLKHRILAHLYRRAVALSHLDKSPYELRKFYMYFDQIKALRMWKIQLLDEDHVLIKYSSEEVVTLRSGEPNSHAAFFVVYNMTTTEVLSMYQNNSPELVDICENFTDFFRNSNLNLVHGEFRYAQHTSSPSNNIYAQLVHQRFKQTIISAKNGGINEARKRVLAQLPISAQSYSSSPYLDLSLFSYDEKWISLMERPKACSELPIHFFGRESGITKFRIYPGPLERPNTNSSARKLVAFIFHPTDPFAISVQKTNYEYVVNFHVRKAPFSSKKSSTQRSGLDQVNLPDYFRSRQQAGQANSSDPASL